MANWPIYFLLAILALRLGFLDLVRIAWRRVRRAKRVAAPAAVVVDIAAARRRLR